MVRLSHDAHPAEGQVVGTLQVTKVALMIRILEYATRTYRAEP